MPPFMKNTDNQLNKFIKIIKQSLQGEEQDYTQGSISRAAVLLAIPMILELIMESVFAVVDMYFVGKLGKNAISAVGLTESVITIIYSVAIGLSTAATAIVSRRIGEKDPEGASKAGLQAIMVSVAVTISISIPGYLYAEDILRLMKADEAVVREGAVFTRIMMAGSLSIMLLFMINGIFRGAGDAAMAMRSLWIGSIINIILCPVLIHSFGLKGAAYATVTGRTSGVLYQCYHLFRDNGKIKMRGLSFLPDWKQIRHIVDVAWPATVQFIIASGSWIVLARLVTETGGTDASSGYQIAIRNVVFFILPAWGLSNAAATLVGQNLGAGHPDRAEKSVLLCTKYNAIFMAFVMLLFFVLPETIIGFFTKDATIIPYGVDALRIIGAGYVFYGIGMVMMQALNGAGDTRTPTAINFVGFWLFQIPLAYLLANGMNMGTTGVFLAIPIAETFNAIVAWYFFKKGKWKSIQV